jgi:hypothetical protein
MGNDAHHLTDTKETHQSTDDDILVPDHDRMKVSLASSEYYQSIGLTCTVVVVSRTLQTKLFV